MKTGRDIEWFPRTVHLKAAIVLDLLPLVSNNMIPTQTDIIPPTSPLEAASVVDYAYQSHRVHDQLANMMRDVHLSLRRMLSSRIRVLVNSSSMSETYSF